MNEFLPVGSIVLLKEAVKKTVIMGILQFNTEKKDQVYDYLGVPYPEGYMGEGSSYLFNHSDISEVIFRGYADEEREGMLEMVKLVYQEADKVIRQEE